MRSNPALRRRRSRFDRGTRLLLAAALPLALLVLSLPAHAFPGANGKIAFTDASTGIWTMNYDGAEQARLGTTSYYGILPAWSPDGSQIAYLSYGGYWIVNADGSNLRRLFNPPSDEFDWLLRPAWSPDGKRLALGGEGDLCDGYACHPDEIWVIDADGTNATRITCHNCPEGRFSAKVSLSWSPDGSRIAYTDYPMSYGCSPPDEEPVYCSYNYDEPDIWTIDPDGSDPTQLTTADSGQPSWSPDGRKIAFVRNTHTPPYQRDLYSMNGDGSGVTQLASTPEREQNPDWSPDGTKLVFGAESQVSPGTLHSAIYTSNADGTDRTQLTNLDYDRGDPSWQPLRALNAFPRPGGGTPLRVPFVSAYQACTAPNALHAPPLDSGSCSPPAQASSVLTTSSVGKGSAHATLRTVVGNASTPQDEADLFISARANDVRCAQSSAACPNGAGSDFSGNVVLRSAIRLTDRASGFGGVAATVADTFFQAPLSCLASSDTGRGSDCATTTSADALIPNWVREEKRTVISAFSFELRDPGPNGTGYGPSCPPDCGDGDEGTYLVQGLFAQ